MLFAVYYHLLSIVLIITACCCMVDGAWRYCSGNYLPDNDLCSAFKFSRLKKSSNSCANSYSESVVGEFPDTDHWPMADASEYTAMVARRITSAFENGDDRPHYDYIENLNDKRGFTAGVVGFTTATGDALMVIERYNRQRLDDNNPFASYIPELRRLASLDPCDTQRSSVNKLNGFPNAWRRTAQNDAVFRNAQLKLAREMYFEPALRFAHRLNIQSALGITIFYDTIVQHGWHLTEPDINIQRIINLTGQRGQRSERAYLTDFLHTRRAMLCCYPDNTWPDSAGRTNDLQALLQSRNMELETPILLAASNVTINDPYNERYYASLN
ncbi:lysozyme-like domain-containing protein [Syncephalis fuscata]|nr:lysozyme-like domain-containing protein [Syncephalis fuscata]